MRRIVLVIIAFAGASCSMKPAATPTAEPVPLDQPVISRIVQRRDVIVVRAGRGEPTYSVESKSGTVLQRQMTLTELAGSDPQLFRAIKTMEADTRWAGE
jgi:hypothetical protein